MENPSPKNGKEKKARRDPAIDVALLQGVQTPTSVRLLWGVALAALALAAIGVVSSVLLVSQTGATDSVLLRWTAPGDDGSSGQAAVYDIRYAPAASFNWSSAMQVEGAPAPKSAGSAESLLITGLKPETTYAFALRTRDESGNWSSVSNIAVATTEKAQDTAAPATTIGADTSYVNERVALSWSGADDETAKSRLRFSYRMDGGSWSHFGSWTGRTFLNLPNGTHVLQVRARDEAGNVDATPAQAMFAVRQEQYIVTGVGNGGGPHVRIFNAQGRALSQFFAYNPNFRGGVHVAAADLGGDGIDEIVTGAGRGGGPQLQFYTKDGILVGQFFAFPEGFRGGVNVAAGDVDGDGRDEILVAPESGGGPHIRIFDHKGRLEAQFFAFPETFHGGVNLAVADLDGDGRDEILAAPASGGGPQVRIFSLMRTGLRVVGQFFAYPESQRMGVSLAVGDVLGNDGVPEILTSPTAGGQAAEVKLFSASGKPLRSLFAADAEFRGGASVAAGDLLGFDNTAEIITGTYSNGPPGVFLYEKKDETTLTRRVSFFAYHPAFFGGVNITVADFLP
jgi:hypothetical protein